MQNPIKTHSRVFEVTVLTMDLKFRQAYYLRLLRRLMRKKMKNIKSGKSPGCNFWKGCGNNLKLIGAGRESFFCPQPCGGTGAERHFLYITSIFLYLNDNGPQSLKEEFFFFVIIITIIIIIITIFQSVKLQGAKCLYQETRASICDVCPAQHTRHRTNPNKQKTFNRTIQKGEYGNV